MKAKSHAPERGSQMPSDAEIAERMRAGAGDRLAARARAAGILDRDEVTELAANLQRAREADGTAS